MYIRFFIFKKLVYKVPSNFNTRLLSKMNKKKWAHIFFQFIKINTDKIYIHHFSMIMISEYMKEWKKSSFIAQMFFLRKRREQGWEALYS